MTVGVRGRCEVGSAIYATVRAQRELHPAMVSGRMEALSENNRRTEALSENGQSTNALPDTNRSTNALPENSEPTNALPTNTQPTNALPTNTQPTNTQPISPRSFSNPNSSSHVPVYISPPSSPRLSPRLPPKVPNLSPRTPPELPSSPPPALDFFRIPEYQNLPPALSSPRQEPMLTPSSRSRVSSVSSYQPEHVFLDLRQSIYVRFKDSTTGYFPIYDATNNDAEWGYAGFENGEREGNWVQYYNGDKEMVKQVGSYHLGQKDGVFTTYFDNSKDVFMTVSYSSGRRDGFSLVYQKGNQLLSAIYYNRGVEKKRIEYYANGYLKRISMLTDKPRVYAMIEFQDNGDVLYIGEARRSHMKDSLVYSYNGKGSFFYSHRAQLAGEFEKNNLLLDGKKVPIEDCRSSLRIIDDRVSVLETPAGLLPPWKPLTKTTSGNSHFIDCDGKKRCVSGRNTVVQSGREYERKVSNSILGYPLRVVDANYSEKKLYFFYPYISRENAVEIDNVKLHSEVPGIITSSVVCRREEYVGDMLMKERDYPNTWKLIVCCCDQELSLSWSRVHCYDKRSGHSRGHSHQLSRNKENLHQ